MHSAVEQLLKKSWESLTCVFGTTLLIVPDERLVVLMMPVSHVYCQGRNPTNCKYQLILFCDVHIVTSLIEMSQIRKATATVYVCLLHIMPTEGKKQAILHTQYIYNIYFFFTVRMYRCNRLMYLPGNTIEHMILVKRRQKLN